MAVADYVSHKKKRVEAIHDLGRGNKLSASDRMKQRHDVRAEKGVM